jgi:formylglycine-generating enzyme required for sulfatase activity
MIFFRGFKMLRGSSWYDDSRDCRSASRYRLVPDYAYSALVGFRVCCLLVKQ